MNNNWTIAIALVAALALPAVARAHEGHIHQALGTIASVQGGHVAITTTDGKAVSVMLDKETTVSRGKKRLDATALKVGERVSVDYMDEGKMMKAHAIKLATKAKK